MLKAVLDLFDRPGEETQASQYSVELATAALLSEVIRADHDVNESEKIAYRDILERQFSLDQQALDTLIEDGHETADDAVGLVHFTKVINQKCDNEQKKNILTSLWELAYADDNLAPMEEHTIRRIADLLYIPHSQFIKTKLSVSDE